MVVTLSSSYTVMSAYACLTSSCIAVHAGAHLQQHGLAESVILRDVAKRCYLSMLNSGDERFLLAYKTFDLVLPVDAEELYQVFFFKHLDPFSCLNQKCPSLTP